MWTGLFNEQDSNAIIINSKQRPVLLNNNKSGYGLAIKEDFSDYYSCCNSKDIQKCKYINQNLYDRHLELSSTAKPTSINIEMLNETKNILVNFFKTKIFKIQMSNSKKIISINSSNISNIIQRINERINISFRIYSSNATGAI